MIMVAHEPYVRVVRTPSSQEFTVEGEPSRSFGHRIPRSHAEAPDGVYAGWEWDGRTLTVCNDRYGCSPLYYAADRSTICVSPSITALLQHGVPAAPDHSALSVFVRLGYFLAEDTPFAAVRALPPGARFRWPQETVAAGTILCPPALHLSRAEAISGFIELFRAAIARRAPLDPFVVPLSGGRDSRHILFELLRQGHRPEACVTFRYFPPRNYEFTYSRPRPDEDLRVASLVAAEVGLRHDVLDQPRSRVKAELRKNRLTGFATDEFADTLPLADYLAERDVLVYDGIGGDVWSSGLCFDAARLALLEQGHLREIAEWLLASREAGLQRTLRASFLQQLPLDLAIDRVEGELKRHLAAADPPESFLFWNRVRREIALSPYDLLAGRRVYSPFLDHDLFDFLAALPMSLMLPEGIHTDAINEAYPQYAALPFEDWSAPELKARGHLRRLAAELAATFATRRRSALVNVPFLVPRLLGCAVDGGWGRVARLQPLLALYLLQLEELLD